MNEAFDLGREIYNYRCYFCHGYSGDAKTLAASFLTPPPVAFTKSNLSRQQIENAIKQGKPDSAMMSFKKILKEEEISALAHFVETAFVKRKVFNTRYHTKENGWPDHDRYALANPFVAGEIKLDTSWEKLNDAQKAGKRLYLSACVSCHDQSMSRSELPVWESYPLSWPRNGYSNKLSPPVDAVSEASPYSLHDIKDVYKPATHLQREGEILYEKNCAFCHAQDGSAKHWIGQFIQPHPKNFSQVSIRKQYDKQLLKNKILEGKAGTAMPAWRTVLSDNQVNAVVEYLWDRFQ